MIRQGRGQLLLLYPGQVRIMSRPATIKQVASAANVSVATISRALQTPALVAPQTLARVLQAVEKLSYVPNVQARNLRTARSRVIVALVPDITNPFFGEIIRGIERGAYATGYSVLLGDTQYEESRERSYANLIASGQVDGLLTLMPHLPELFHDRHFPIVSAAEIIDNDQIRRISVDNQGGVAAAIRYLASLGHRHIAYIGGRAGSPVSRDRAAGYTKAVAELGLTIDPRLHLEGNFTAHSGMTAARELCVCGVAFTAVCCANDEMALGAIQELRRHGKRVPDDVSIVGFDDIALARYFDPPLTTVMQPKEQLGFEAISLLLEQLKNPDALPRTIILSTELVIRGSATLARPGKN